MSDTASTATDLQESFLAAMRLVSHSVAVVTTDGLMGKNGATVSSFCSVSATPPTLLICLRSNSQIAQSVYENDCFCLNILPDYKSEIANRFAGKDDITVADRFEGIEYFDLLGIPAIVGATVFVCQAKKRLVYSTHDIVIGEVMKTHLGSKKPLTYLDGQYVC